MKLLLRAYKGRIIRKFTPLPTATSRRSITKKKACNKLLNFNEQHLKDEFHTMTTHTWVPTEQAHMGPIWLCWLGNIATLSSTA